MKYCKYLPSHGWQPVVLTARPVPSADLDESLLNQVPESVKVYRTHDVDPAKWEDSLARWTHRSAADPIGSGDHGSQPRPANIFRRALERSKRILKALLKESPDSHLFWVPFAVARGALILMSRRIDVIYCSTPPHSSHLVAYILGKIFRKPYVLDFRDPWHVANSLYPPRSKNSRLLSLETATKQRIVRSAAMVVAVSNGERDECRAEFPTLPDSHFQYITNGFDSADFKEVGAVTTVLRKPQVRLRLIHAGTVYPGTADDFLAALEHIATHLPDLADSIEVRLLGEITHSYMDRVGALVSRGLVVYYGYQPHSKALSLMRDSDVLVILMSGGIFRGSHLPSKGFEYLKIGKPVLAISPEGELTRMLCAAGIGHIVPPGSIDLLCTSIAKLRRLQVDDSLDPVVDSSVVAQYERSSLASRLASILDGVYDAHCRRRAE